MTYQPTLEFAQKLDQDDPLRDYRNRFYIPETADGQPSIYLCGNSLGLQPRTVEAYVQQELEDWAKLGVEGHFRARRPWMPYHELLTPAAARLVGALPEEVVVMNSLTVNLHLMMVSFYRPVPGRYKIVMEANGFPSDQYAVKSQLQYHGFAPDEALLEFPLRENEVLHRTEDMVQFLEEHGAEIALVLLGGVNYYTGQAFDIPAIAEAARRRGCMIGLDLAHAAGNLPLQLHDWQIDFAVWCSYKYLNSGPGGIAGCFVHQRHLQERENPRFAGWWGQNKQTRFLMGPEFDPIPTAEGWQLSNPPILLLAALRASLDIFDEAGMDRLRQKSVKLTGYLEHLIRRVGPDKVQIITPGHPEARGCQLSLVIGDEGRRVFEQLTERGVICDWREPDVIRIAPVPLYNSFEDVYHFARILGELVQGAP